MLAKAVARHTTGEKICFHQFIYTACFPNILAAFIRVVGSEFVQKYLGEGPRMVRDVFRLAKGMILFLFINKNLLLSSSIH
jgi:ATP-dependent 26S proteasome regulatory subunit